MSLAASSAVPGRTSTAGVIAVRRPGCAGRQQGSWRYLQQTVSDRVNPAGEERYPSLRPADGARVNHSAPEETRSG
jgi:hypothetical protein